VSLTGAQANNDSRNAVVSEYGRFVAFDSLASNLVPGDSAASWDVFVRDLITGTVERVSVDTLGGQANGHSNSPAISRDGRYVAFVSVATNLVVGDTNGSLDVFVRDRVLGVTERVSVSSSGAQGTEGSGAVAMSGDGRVIAFTSLASNLVAGDTNGRVDVFVRDLANGTTTRVNLAANGAEADAGASETAISADGRFVGFSSAATNLVPQDNNGLNDVFVVDRLSGAIERVSVNINGFDANNASVDPALSADGRFVAFTSSATDLDVLALSNFGPDIFVRDRLTGLTTQISVAVTTGTPGTWCWAPAISSDGRFVAFLSEADNLVPGDTNFSEDVFLHDRASGTTRRVNVSSLGAQQGGWGAGGPSVSANGRFVVFHSRSNRLVDGDTNGKDDVFVRDEYVGPFEYCTSSTTSNGCAPTMTSSGSPSASATAGFVLTATNVDGGRAGLVFYGVGGANGQPLAGGSTSYLCVRAPVQRTPPQTSGGSTGQCDGSLAVDWLAFLANHPTALGQPITAGLRVNAQAWFRDPLAPSGVNLSNATEFDVLP
jgi:Tol biopolymer transport system component